MPLGDGSFVPLCIVRAHHHVVDVAAYAGKNSDPVAVLRTSDRALVLHRWRRSHLRAVVPEAQPENDRWITAAHAERVVAKRLNRLPFDEKPLSVHVLRSGEPIAGSMFTWNEPLDAQTLQSLIDYIAEHPGVTIRPYGAAAAQLREFARTPIRRVRITAAYDDVELPHVEELHIEAPMDVAGVLAQFPSVRALRIAANGINVSFKALPCTVRALDCSHAARVDLKDAPPLEGLRLAYLDAAPSLDALPSSLRTLSLEHLTVSSLEAVSLLRLEQLELHGLWQFELPDAEPLLAIPSLLRAAIDIGGRRKNVELYKRASWAYPWPFAFVMEAAASGNKR